MKSSSPWPAAIVSASRACSRSANGTETPVSAASASTRPASFCIIDVVKVGVIARKQRAGLDLEESRADDRAAQDLEQHRGGHPTRLAQGQCLRQQLGRAADEDLQRELHDPRLLGRTDVEDPRADPLEQRARVGERPAGPDTMIVRFPERTTVGLPLTGARR